MSINQIIKNKKIVYLLKTKDNKMFKIGKTDGIHTNRIENLHSIWNFDLDNSFLVLCNNHHELERTLHYFFNNHNIKDLIGDGSSEFFDINCFDEVIEVINILSSKSFENINLLSINQFNQKIQEELINEENRKKSFKRQGIKIKKKNIDSNKDNTIEETSNSSKLKTIHNLIPSTDEINSSSLCKYSKIILSLISKDCKERKYKSNIDNKEYKEEGTLVFIGIKDMIDKFKLNPNRYYRNSDISSIVLNKAIKELNENTPYILSIEFHNGISSNNNLHIKYISNTQKSTNLKNKAIEELRNLSNEEITSVIKTLIEERNH